MYLLSGNDHIQDASKAVSFVKQLKRCKPFKYLGKCYVFHDGVGFKLYKTMQSVKRNMVTDTTDVYIVD